MRCFSYKLYATVAPIILYLVFCLASIPTLAQLSSIPTFNAIDQEPQLLLSRYLKYKSMPGNEAEAGMFLHDYCKKRGLYTKIFTKADSSFNFAASLYPLDSGKPNIVFLNHIDVVSPGDENEWTYPPFSGSIVDEQVWGRGAIDAKGLAVMQLMAMLEYAEAAKHNNLPYNVTLLAVSGEETGGFNGAKLIADNYLEELKPVVIFGEGGSGLDDVVPSRPEQRIFGISVAEKSNFWLKLDLKMNSFGHGAAPPQHYVNKSMLKALYKLNNVKVKYNFNKVNKTMFKQLGNLEGGLKGFVMKHIHWPIFRPLVRKFFNEQPFAVALVSNTVILTNLSNPPGPPNQISTKVTAYLDCRLLPGTNRKKFIRDIKYGLFEPKFKVSVLNESPEAPASKQDHYYYAMERAIKKIYPDVAVMPILFPATTDNNYFRAKNIPVFGIMPIMMTRDMMASVHNVDEKISIADLHMGIETISSMLRELLAPKGGLKMQVELHGK